MKDNSRSQCIILSNNQVHYTETRQAKKEGNTIYNMMEAHGLTRERVHRLLDGKSRKYKIGKHAPLYESEDKK